MRILFCLSLLLLALYRPAAQRKDVIQFDISSILNARPVTTLSGAKLTTWTKGIDGNGAGNGYLTQSAASFKGNKDVHALPDDPLIPATGAHPDILLHYANQDSVTMQAHAFSGEDYTVFTTPRRKYKAIFLAVTSSEGQSALHVILSYDNGIVSEDYTLPDYYADLNPGATNLSYLVHDLAKWGNKNNMTEKNHHNIDLIKITPDKTHNLKSITISKTKPGYLVLWGGTGITAG